MFSPRARRRMLATPLWALLLPLVSCGDDDRSPTTPGATTLDASGTIGPAGGSIRSADGRLVLTVPAGALDEDTEIVITEVTAKDLSVTGEGMDVSHALTMEPAGLAFDVGITLELQYVIKDAGDNDSGVDFELRLEMVVVSEDDEQTAAVRAIPEQTAVLGPAGSDGRQELVLHTLPRELVLGTPVAVVDGATVATTVAGLSAEVPAQAVENTSFTAQVLFAYSLALTFASDAHYGPVALVNLATLLEEGDVVDVQEVVDPVGLSKQFALLAYVAGIPGPATWNLALRTEFNVLAALAFPDAQNLPLVLGAIEVLFQFAPINLAILATTGGHDDLGPGLWYLTALVESAFPVRGLTGFPFDNTLAVGAGNGTTLWSLDAATPAVAVYTGFNQSSLVIWECLMMAAGNKDAAPGSIAMVQAGPAGARLTQWIPADNAFGATGVIEFQSGVTDLQPFDADALSGGFVYVASASGAVRMVEYDADSGYYDDVRQITDFPEAPGTPFTAAVRRGAGAVVVTAGSPGMIYHHDLVDTFAPAVAVGDAGDSPRRIRTAGDLAFVSNFDSDELTILAWSPTGAVSVVGAVTVGDGPVGIDALELPDGTVAVVSTGFHDDTSTVTIVDATGAVISNTTSDLPDGALSPGHAVWLRGDALHYAVTCNESGHLVVVDPGLE